MVEVDLYCRRCNRRFGAEDASAPCQGCGGMSMAWRNAPTIVFADTQPIPYEATDPQTDELIETRLGNYWIESFLGEGGMRGVYRGQHLTLERPCAIKVLRPSIADKDATSVETFLAEARSATALVHPHVVTLHTIGNEPICTSSKWSLWTASRWPGCSTRNAKSQRLKRRVGWSRSLPRWHWPIDREWSIGTSSRAILWCRGSVARSWPILAWPNADCSVEGQGETFLVGTPHYIRRAVPRATGRSEIGCVCGRRHVLQSRDRLLADILRIGGRVVQGAQRTGAHQL